MTVLFAPHSTPSGANMSDLHLILRDMPRLTCTVTWKGSLRPGDLGGHCSRTRRGQSQL